jgi:hypothetical protein
MFPMCGQCIEGLVISCRASIWALSNRAASHASGKGRQPMNDLVVKRLLRRPAGYDWYGVRDLKKCVYTTESVPDGFTGAQLQQLRRHMPRTQSEMARLLNVTQNTVSRWELEQDEFIPEPYRQRLQWYLTQPRICKHCFWEQPQMGTLPLDVAHSDHERYDQYARLRGLAEEECYWYRLSPRDLSSEALAALRAEWDRAKANGRCGGPWIVPAFDEIGQPKLWCRYCTDELLPVFCLTCGRDLPVDPDQRTCEGCRAPLTWPSFCADDLPQHPFGSQRPPLEPW